MTLFRVRTAYGSGKSWNLNSNFLCLESHGKAYKINQVVAAFLTRVHLSGLKYIIVVYCQTRFVVGQLYCHQIQSNYSYLKFWVNVTGR